jgi:hypothetical protein
MSEEKKEDLEIGEIEENEITEETEFQAHKQNNDREYQRTVEQNDRRRELPRFNQRPNRVDNYDETRRYYRPLERGYRERYEPYHPVDRGRQRPFERVDYNRTPRSYIRAERPSMQRAENMALYSNDRGPSRNDGMDERGIVRRDSIDERVRGRDGADGPNSTYDSHSSGRQDHSYQKIGDRAFENRDHRFSRPGDQYGYEMPNRPYMPSHSNVQFGREGMPPKVYESRGQGYEEKLGYKDHFDQRDRFHSTGRYNDRGHYFSGNDPPESPYPRPSIGIYDRRDMGHPPERPFRPNERNGDSFEHQNRPFNRYDRFERSGKLNYSQERRDRPFPDNNFSGPKEHQLEDLNFGQGRSFDRHEKPFESVGAKMPKIEAVEILPSDPLSIELERQRKEEQKIRTEIDRIQFETCRTDREIAKFSLLMQSAQAELAQI